MDYWGRSWMVRAFPEGGMGGPLALLLFLLSFVFCVLCFPCPAVVAMSQPA
jgi:hypothetical protein